jgi:hypothetical protein
MFNFRTLGDMLANAVKPKPEAKPEAKVKDSGQIKARAPRKKTK